MSNKEAEPENESLDEESQGHLLGLNYPTSLPTTNNQVLAVGPLFVKNAYVKFAEFCPFLCF